LGVLSSACDVLSAEVIIEIRFGQRVSVLVLLIGLLKKLPVLLSCFSRWKERVGVAIPRADEKIDSSN
jgi:hypothetical protein